MDNFGREGSCAKGATVGTEVSGASADRDDRVDSSSGCPAGSSADMVAGCALPVDNLNDDGVPALEKRIN